MRIKNLFSKVHLYGGLISGLVVFIVSITGVLYAFKDEFEQFDEYRFVQAQDTPLISPSFAFEKAQTVRPNTKIHSVVFNGREKAIEVIYYQGSPLYYGAAYLNPYTGELLHETNFLKSFWGLVLIGHRYLWLPPAIGGILMKFMVISYFVLLITGFVIWWPKSRRTKGAFWFSKTQNKTAQLREWHQVLGLYATVFIVLFLLTGSVWLFQDFGQWMYRATGGQKEAKFSIPPSDTTLIGTVLTTNPLDSVYRLVRAEFGETAQVELHGVDSPEKSILVEVQEKPGYWRMNYLFYDQYSLNEIPSPHIYGRFADAGPPELIRRVNYEVHTGAIGGFAGKLLAAIMSLLSASLPVTGFWFWLKRRKKKSKRSLRNQLIESQ
ncbi:PepSY-associated TM helix domain-containing protein [Mangrovibacterium diazotrophicum]|uniref:Putative iron-regulated membrane protein n=1 Tax=Mangrovibacterium diazotrophicum TaxID=1261403 RepID=A0A419W8S9_9BACT|nr:PepSY-associated TM helix domain-containing protein [Mangrovibacterium diazotrophicum]RKD91849.1 putative iron-regulated membrane protein [Mangrovibacterium diazotrophicum]